MGIREIAGTGDRHATLVAMRDKLAADMDEAPPAVVAQIAGRLSAVLAEIDGLNPIGVVDGLEDIRARRAARLAAADAGVGAAKKATRQRRPGSG